MFPLLVAGLGNPGREYSDSRHNLGWVVLEAFARKRGLSWKAVPEFECELARWDVGGAPRWLVKPLSYMNQSGRSVAAVARYYRVEPSAIVAVYDDLTIDLGLIKVSVDGSAGGHNGVNSLIEHLGSSFARYRLGIGPKQPAPMELSDFVLGRFSPEQQLVLTQKLDSYVQGLELLLSRGLEPAMNQLNRRDQK